MGLEIQTVGAEELDAGLDAAFDNPSSFQSSECPPQPYNRDPPALERLAIKLSNF